MEAHVRRRALRISDRGAVSITETRAVNSKMVRRLPMERWTIATVRKARHDFMVGSIGYDTLVRELIPPSIQTARRRDRQNYVSPIGTDANAPKVRKQAGAR